MLNKKTTYMTYEVTSRVYKQQDYTTPYISLSAYSTYFLMF